MPSARASSIDSASCTAMTSRERLLTRSAPRRWPRPPCPGRRSGRAADRRSPPLNRPPTIGTTPLIEALDRSQRRFHVGRLRVVHEPDAANSATSSIACSSPRNARPPRSWRRRGRRRWRPPSPPPSRRPRGAGRAAGSRSSGTSRSLPLRCAADDPAVSITVPVVERRCASKTAAACPCRSRASCSAARSSAFTTAKSLACWFSKIRAFAAAYASTFGWRSR